MSLTHRQLALGKRYSEEPFFKRPIVILTPKDKGSVDEEISLRLQSADLELYTRQGNPAFPQDLDMVAAMHADTVIVLVGALFLRSLLSSDEPARHDHAGVIFDDGAYCFRSSVHTLETSNLWDRDS